MSDQYRAELVKITVAILAGNLLFADQENGQIAKEVVDLAEAIITEINKRTGSATHTEPLEEDGSGFKSQ